MCDFRRDMQKVIVGRPRVGYKIVSYDTTGITPRRIVRVPKTWMKAHKAPAKNNYVGWYIYTESENKAEKLWMYATERLVKVLYKGKCVTGKSSIGGHKGVRAEYVWFDE